MIDLDKALVGYKGQVRFNEPMAPYTTLKIGGPADAMLYPTTIPEVADILCRVRGVPYFIFGTGSNLIVRDRGIAGVVLNMKHLNHISMPSPNVISAQAGTLFPRLSVYAMERGLSGLEFAVGIPGTVGGAVAMNAGIPGEDTMLCLKSVTFVAPNGEVVTKPSTEIVFGYRSAALAPATDTFWPVVEAEFVLRPARVADIRKKMKRLLAKRRATQPLSVPNAGSIFKNPERHLAGALIETAGLKGCRIGNAEVSSRHANFIVNNGDATASEVVALIQKVREVVAKRHGIFLETEVKVVGRDDEG